MKNQRPLSRTILTLAVIMLFVASIVPFAAASYHESDSTDSDNSDNNVNVRAETGVRIGLGERSAAGEEAAEANVEARANSRANSRTEASERSDAEARAEQQGRREQQDTQDNRRGLREEQRDLAKIRIKYQRKKEQYQEARAEFQQKREAFLAERDRLRKQLKECKDDTSEECESVRAQFAVKSKPFLSSSASAALASIEKIETGIEMSAELSEEERMEMLEELGMKKTSLEAAAEVIADLDEDATPEELQKAAEQLRTAWKDAQDVMRKHVGKMLNNRLGGIIVQLEQLQIRVEKVITKLEEKEYDVSILTEHMADFDEEVASIKAHHQAAVELHAEGNVREAHQELKEAQLGIKETRKLLGAIVHEIKQTAKDQRAAQRYNKKENENKRAKEKDDDAEDGKLEIEVELENGKAEVEVTIDGAETEFTLDSTDQAVIISEIVARTGLSQEQVSSHITIKVKEDDEKGKDSDDSEGDEEDE